VSAPAYDRIGLSYSEVRRAEPRFEGAIWRALGDDVTAEMWLCSDYLPDIVEHDRV
jgi:hypothetical protein